MAALPQVLGVIGGRWGDPEKMMERVRAGLPYKALDSVAKTLELSPAEVSRLFSIPQRTLMRRKASRRLASDESDRVLRVARVVAHAIDTLEGREAAVGWIKSPNPALGRKTPLSMLDTDVGTREVERILGRIDHGVFS